MNFDKRIFSILIILFLIALNVYLIPSKGTGDLQAHIDRLNLVRNYSWGQFISKCLDFTCFKSLGFLENYPPFTIVLLFTFMKILPYKLIGMHYTIKLTIFFFYILTYLTFIYIYKKANINKKKINIINISTIFFSLLSITLNSQGLGYLDIISSFFLLWFLYFLLLNKKYFVSGFLYSISILIKFQPLIIAPIIFCYFINIRKNENSLNLKNGLMFILGLSMSIFILMIINYHAFLFLKNSLFFALSNTKLSASLNIFWIITIFLRIYFPSIYGLYRNDYYNYIDVEPQNHLLLLGKFIFIIMGILILFKFIKQIKHIELNTLITMQVFYFSYFILSSGVHENHNYITLILAILIFIRNTNFYARLNLQLINGINFINMFLFYGISGNRDFLSDIIFKIDFTVIFSVIFSFIYFVYIYLFFKNRILNLFEQSSTRLKSIFRY